MMHFLKSRDGLRRRLLPGKLVAAICFLLLSVAAVWQWLDEPQTLTAIQLTEEEAAALPQPEETEEIETSTEVAEEEGEAVATASYFAAYRMDREEARGEELAMLRSLMEDETVSEEARAEAEQRCLTLAEISANEIQAESLLEAYGFGETVVILDTDRATVMVAVDMDPQKAAQIAETVDGVSGCGFENVVVVNR